MKLISACFTNFRILKNLELDFSISDNKPLTVIRAANETGKTTTENALIWGLYGSESLPEKGKKYQLYPSDSIKKGLRTVNISVEIEFKTERVIPLGRGKQTVKNCHYRLIRSCTEYPSTNEIVKREGEQVTLYEITPTGSDKVEQFKVKSIIEESIPEALKDVYFTDGDRAMSFIEAAATQSVKRSRVQNAVEALLGLNILEKIKKDVKYTANKFSQEIDNNDYKKELERLNDTISGQQEDLSDWNDELKDLELNITEGERKLKSLRIEIEKILKIGDKEKLVLEIKKIEKDILSSKKKSQIALEGISKLLRNKKMSASMINVAANYGLEILNNLSENKQLPKINIPILEEILDRKMCFCGETLDNKTERGKSKRKIIERSIEKSKESDSIQEIVTNLFYSVRSTSFGDKARKKWMDSYAEDSRNYSENYNNTEKLEEELKKKQGEIDKVDDSLLKEYREQEKNLRRKINTNRHQVGKLEAQIRETQGRKLLAEKNLKSVESKLSKNDTSTGKLQLTRMCEIIFSNIFDRLREKEVLKVSKEMNRIFLEMIGSDPDKNDLTLITKAELTTNFDILVFGAYGHPLNPDQDLNGASRRAITLAFILALTKVSRVSAPNVIDTPLGMMSGFVKQAVLHKILQESSQVILFLTHDEIKGVEEILDQKSGKIYTLTNPAHYPKMLANDPNTNVSCIIRCSCNHRETCSVCERKTIDMEVI